MTKITLVHAALDEMPDGSIVVRGVIKNDCLRHLKTDDYQREALPLTALSSIIGAIQAGERLPDIELGMRGQRYKERDGEFDLLDDVFIIDGLQRTNGAMHVLTMSPDAAVGIGAVVHFSTTKEWERERFRILNTLRSRVSANVILRNRADESEAIKTLFALTANDANFVLRNRICWKQKMLRGELLTALVFAKTVGRLVSHKAPARRTAIDELVPALDKAVEIFGVNVLRETVRSFFDLVDECWGIRRVQYREGAAHMKGTFLYVLASLLSDHHDFWKQPDERRLFVEASLRRKLAQFPVTDPAVVQLASSGGKSRDMLYMMLRDHINAGKRTKRLASRNGDMVALDDDEEVSNGNDEEESKAA